MMDSLIAFEHDSTSLFNRLPLIAASIDLPFVCSLWEAERVSEQSYHGIYRIDIATDGGSKDLKSWLETFKKEWERSDKIEWTPKLQKKRMDFHTELPAWMPLYLGKSTNVAHRVKQHLNLGIGKTTFALKLKARPRMTERPFRLHAIRLRKESYDLIAPHLEKALRNRYNPIVGKQ